jgi:glycerol-3-phosphate dehydrogenase (NAD(P)+)
MKHLEPIKIGVVGAGSWGTTLALLLHNNGHWLTLWEFHPEVAREMERRRENYEFLPGVPLPSSMRITSDLWETVTDKEMVLLAVPSHVLRTVLEQIPFEALGQAVVISVVKGIEAGTLMRMSEMALEVWKIFPPENIAALSGPSLSREVVQGVPTTVVIASTSLHTAQWAQRIFFAPRFRVYASQDVIGVELGGALKNVIAIAAGISDGLGFGDNAKGALLTRGLSEIARLGILMGGKEKTFAGLSGMGDLITTCVSSLSRNHYVGYHLGKGRKLPEILSEMKMVAEGINTTKAALGLAQKYDLEMPIVKAVHAILFEDKDPRQSVGELMTRMLKVED